MSRPTKAELDQQEQADLEAAEEEEMWDASILLAYPCYGDVALAWAVDVTTKELDLGNSSPEEWADFLKSIEEDLAK
jgi:hypothetical protein